MILHLTCQLLFFLLKLSKCVEYVIQDKSGHDTLVQSDDISANHSSDLDFTSTAPYIFAGVRDLLQQWPNTFSPNGHSIVPCTVPPFTSLYHARMDNLAPSSPEWLAFDAELSYGVMGSSRNSHLMTYQTTREIQCLYFDGMSAVLVGEGRIDSQMVFAFGNVTGPGKAGGHPENGILFGDLERAAALCDWIRTRALGGPGWGIEGIVRMAAGFELIWCDFSSPSLKLISYLDVTVPLNNERLDHQKFSPGVVPAMRRESSEIVSSYDSATPFPLPTLTRSQAPADPTSVPDERLVTREPFQWSEVWQWFVSASWHYGRSGAGSGRAEDRIKPATCSFLTYYAPAFKDIHKSLAEQEREALNLTNNGRWKGSSPSNRASALQELSRRRRHHTLADISPQDTTVLTEASEMALGRFIRPEGDKNTSNKTECSGVDWTLLANTISQTYTDSLTELNQILVEWQAAIGNNDSPVRRWHDIARDHTHSLLMSFFEYPAHGNVEIRRKELNTLSARGRAAYMRCQFSWTRLLFPDQGVVLNDNEALLKWAFEETVGGICSIILEIGLGVEHEWESRYAAPNVIYADEDDQLQQMIKIWTWKIEELIAWLGWTGDHVTCKEVCKWDEKCKRSSRLNLL